MSLLLRTNMSLSDTASGIRALVTDVSRAVAVTKVSTLREVVTSSAATEQSLTRLLLGLAILAVSVGAVGVYSLISYTVSWRTREIGLRMALGANRTNIATWVVRESLLLATLGSVAGLTLSLAAVKVLRQFLFETSPADPLTFVAVVPTILLVALLAAWSPASRAAKIDPMHALHME